MIDIELNVTEIELGGFITGRAHWKSESGKTPSQFLVTCLWRTEGEGSACSRPSDVVSAPEIGGRSEFMLEFKLKVSRHAPVSYEGKLFRIVWEVIAEAELSMARDETAAKPFRVIPGRWTPDEVVDGNDAKEEMYAKEAEIFRKLDER